MKANRQLKYVLNSPIDVISWDLAVTQLSQWSSQHKSRVVCICNVHSLVTATLNLKFGQVLKSADMATPDGAPVAWMLRRMGHVDQLRINGPDLMWRYCEHAQDRNESIFFYGSTEETLANLKANLLTAFPKLKIAGSISPPFRALTNEEDAANIAQINSSGAGIVWLSLGCPKQEFWMAEHHDSVKAVMVGVGAAFEYHAGTIKRAPKSMQDFGLEWFYRLITEPRRLWKRYLVTNTLFVIAALRQLLSPGQEN